MFAVITLLLFAALGLFAAWRNWRVAEREIRKFAERENLAIVELKKSWFDRGPFETNWGDFPHEIATASLRDQEGFVSKAWLLVCGGKDTADKNSVRLIWHDQYRNGERA